MSFYKWSTTAASNATADGTINWAEGQAPSSVNDSARAMMAAAAKFRKDVAGITTGGTSTAFTVTSNQVFASLTVLDLNLICIIPHATSGASPTLAVDGLTARAINISTAVAVPTGALLVGTPYLLLYVNASTEFIVLNTPAVFGALAASSVTSTGLIKSSSASAGIGYATGAGSTVTQGTSKSTGVTINALCGTITTHNASLAVNTWVTFTVTNSSVAATDRIILNTVSGATTPYSVIIGAVGAGSFDISISHFTGGTTTDAIVIGFEVLKGVTS